MAKFSIEELLLKIQIFLRRNMPINAENIVSDENIDKNNIKIGRNKLYFTPNTFLNTVICTNKSN